MKCPLCDSTEFQDCGKTIAGDRKYLCEVCQSFFSSRIFNQTLDDQRPKLRLPDINFMKAAGDRFPNNQDSRGTFSIPLVFQLITTVESYLVTKKTIIAIAILYQIALVAMMANALMVNYPDLKWDEALNRFSYNDAHHYVFLSQHGYQSAGEGVEFIVFFPLYPLLIHLLTPILGNPYLTGLVISNIGSAIGHTAFAMFLLEARFELRKVWRIMGLLFLTPIAIYFNMVYTEGVFLATTALFLYFLEKRQYSLAVISGFCAALTRSLGFFCIIPYLAHFLRNKLWKTNKSAIVQSLVIPMGTMIYLAINAWVFGDPFHYKVFMKNVWNKEVFNPINQYIYNTSSMIKGDWIDNITIYVDQASTILLPVVVILYVYLMFHKKKIISSELLSWTVAQWVIIASQSFWLSNTRYIGLILPFYIMLEEIIGTFFISYGIVVIAFGWLAIYAIDLFARSQWIY